MRYEPFDVWSPRFRSVLGQFTRIPEPTLRDTARKMEARAKRYAPVETGELRASIRAAITAGGTGRGVMGQRVFLTCPGKYAPIEFGSRRGHVAQRFLERAMHDELDDLEQEIADTWEDALVGRFTGAVGHIGPRYSRVVR